MPHTNESGKVHPAIAALIVIVLIGIVASVAIVVQNNQSAIQDTATTQATQSTSTQQSTASTTTGSTDTTQYKNGTYSATASYATPGGMESIELTVTIENGVITKTELAQKATDRESKQYQAAFASGYASLVVGKSVNEVSLSRVAGSSLTSNGFNSALDSIKADAKA